MVQDSHRSPLVSKKLLPKTDVPERCLLNAARAAKAASMPDEPNIDMSAIEAVLETPS